MPSDEVDLILLRRRIAKARTQNDVSKVHSLEQKLADVMRERATVDSVYKGILERLTGSESAAEHIMEDVNAFNDAIDWDCYEPVIYALKQNCFERLGNSYAARRLYTMVTACRIGYSGDDVTAAIIDVCTQKEQDTASLDQFQLGRL